MLRDSPVLAAAYTVSWEHDSRGRAWLQERRACENRRLAFSWPAPLLRLPCLSAWQLSSVQAPAEPLLASS